MVEELKLKERIMSYSRGNEDYWSFRGKAVREHAHAYLQYPAMMVPQMQGELIRIIRESVPGIQTVYDPFVGSGTVMTESMLQGLNFRGQDINPLAVLICQAKKGPFFEAGLRKKIDTLLRGIDEDRDDSIDIEFPNLLKWFCPDVAKDLSRIRRGIRGERSKWGRRFFWVALAETVRLSSNSRTSTFKLHVRPAEEISGRDISPIDIFTKIVNENYDKLLIVKSLLEREGFLKRSRFVGSIEIKLADSAQTSDVIGGDEKCFDLLVTSPPYGDNATTVPYGQYSYLPLQWIDMSDIDGNGGASFISSTHEIDRRSLGGSRKNALEEAREIEEISKTFAGTIKNLQDEPGDRKSRVAAFCRDFNKCIDPILKALKKGAYMIWTIGNRQVGRKTVPMDDILSELLRARGAKDIARLQRIIPSKRMAVKNNFADTMRMETILVFKKGNS
jgi:hypothetical protein